LFAVYDFLETKLGVRWLWPGRLGEVIPARTDIAVSDLRESHSPALIHARVRHGGALTGPAEAWAGAETQGHYYNDEVVWTRRQGHDSRDARVGRARPQPGLPLAAAGRAREAGVRSWRSAVGAGARLALGPVRPVLAGGAARGAEGRSQCDGDGIRL